MAPGPRITIPPKGGTTNLFQVIVMTKLISHALFVSVFLGLMAPSLFAQPPGDGQPQSNRPSPRQPPGFGQGSDNGWRQMRRGGPRSTTYLKNSGQIKSLLAPVVSKAAASTARVVSDDREVAFGTVVAAEGLIVTKASQLAGKLECRLSDGRKLPATLVGEDIATDLALLRVNAKTLTPIEWATSAATPGSIVAATGRGADPLLIGVVSDVSQPMPGPDGGNVQHGWLGINLQEGAEVSEVSPSSAAEKAGLKEHDHIRRLDGAEVRSKREFIESLSKMPPNRKVSLVVSRKDKEKDKELELEAVLSRSSGRLRLPQDNWGGGPFSDRRYGFAAVIPHDLPLAPAECGGPLVDIDGRCLGVNIARALRVASYALPPGVVQATVEKIQAKAKKH
jgi:serine protease Do